MADVARTRLLRRLVEDGLYPLDEAALADAILTRTALRWTVPDVALQPRRGDRVRSFRRDARARSFRLAPRRGGVAHP